MSESSRCYHVREILGRGGFGTVYRAELVTGAGFGKVVALKVLHPAVENRQGHLARLRDEARLLGIVRHRALVGADALVLLDGQWTVVMEYVPGVTVHEILKAERHLPASVALTVVEEVADALETMWSTEATPGRPLHLLHRDLKPNNLQLTDQGDVKVLDFGLAQADFGQREVESRRVVYGSPPYLSPERLEALDSPAGDVFALGASLAEMLTGRRPEPASARPTPHAQRVRKLLDAVDEELQDPSLTDFIARTLAYEPEDRPTMLEVCQHAKALRKRHREPDIREWAKRAVPRVQALRDVSTGELSGRALEEASEEQTLRDMPGAAARTWEPESQTSTYPPESNPVLPGAVAPTPVEARGSGPPPTHPLQERSHPLPEPSGPTAAPAPAPQPSGSGCMGWLKGLVAASVVSLGALGAGAMVLVVGGFLLMGLSCWAIWEPMSLELCVSTVDDIERGLDSAKSERRSVEEARRLTEQLHRQCRTGKATAWQLIDVEVETQPDYEDGRWSQSDQERFARRLRRTFGIR